MAREKRKFYLAEISTRSDRRIMNIKRKNFFLTDREFYRFNQRIIPSRSEGVMFPVPTVTVQ